ncbi:MAG: DNA mismatch repair protein MutS, partial [Muribaculaceae bacterium]|nr:DNA mismatch repair protein MutS [Muribaculaceae bacterium]
HELNEMERTFKRIVNYNVTVREVQGKVVFLRKLVKGGSEHSFGIHVAKLAGMPPSIVNRAAEVLKQLEQANRSTDHEVARNLGDVATSRSGYQLSIFQLDDPVLEQIRDEILHIDINNLTPMQALTKLHDIKSILTGKQSS